MTQDQSGVFHIETEEEANWYLRKRNHLLLDIETVKRQSAEMLNGLHGDMESLDYRFRSEFEHWLEGKIEQGKKSVKLWYGTAGKRTTPTSVSVEDSELAIEWAKENAINLLEQEWVLDKKQFNQIAMTMLKCEGVVLPGVKVTPEHETFYLPKLRVDNEDSVA